MQEEAKKVWAYPGSDIELVLTPEDAAAIRRLDEQFGGSELDLPACWTRGGLTVASLQREFNDPGWAARGQYRALIQFAMNWNAWPSTFDRYAMIDSEPPDSMPMDQRARIAALVHCLCERDHFIVPDWTEGVRARRRGGVLLIDDARTCNMFGCLTDTARQVKRVTPEAALRYRVWFEPEILDRR